MSPNWSDGYAPLRIEPTPSPRFRLLFVLLCLAFAACPWLAGLAWPSALGLSAVAIGGGVGLWRTRPELAGPPVRLRWEGEGGWFRVSERGDAPLTLLGDSCVMPWLVVLNFRAERRRWSLVLWPDSVDPQTFRRLRVRLRIDGLLPPESDPGDR